MKISLNVLKYYVDINVPVQELCDRMVMAGFEVESIEAEGENLKNVVVGKIEKITPHEDSDHLQICQMDIGKEEPLQIVTGAQNIKVGELVPAALDDSYLPNGMHIVIPLSTTRPSIWWKTGEWVASTSSALKTRPGQITRIGGFLVSIVRI